MPPPWLTHINSAQKKEGRLDSSRWIQLATIGSDNSPRVRTVVFRGWNDFYEMEIFTDKRSQKFHEIELNNKVELCWFFPKSKCQFRLRGTSTIDIGEDRLRSWRKLNNKAKIMWSWPFPGDHYDKSVGKAIKKKLNKIIVGRVFI